MPGILALVLIAIVALIVLSFAVHFLFSPWLLVALVILALVKFWPRRSHRSPARPGLLRSRSWPLFDPGREQIYYLGDARRAQVGRRVVASMWRRYAFR